MRPKIICLTPVKNEAWILNTFLKSTSIWADQIIIADQNSTDGSQEIIKRYPKATIIENNCPTINEYERQKLLINAARQIPGNKLLLAFDVDEILSSEAFNIENWKNILCQKPGTIFHFQWAMMFPNSNKYWEGYPQPLGYMDDNVPHNNTGFFHNHRIPTPDGNHVYQVSEFKLIHLQYMNPERNKRKHRWYQCIELDNPTLAKDAIDIYRKYHYEQQWSDDRMHEVPLRWIEQYKQEGINLYKEYKEDSYWFDNEVELLFRKYGYSHYKKLDIWDDIFKKSDPRSIIDKAVHLWLRKSQPHYYTKARIIDNIIRKVIHY